MQARISELVCRNFVVNVSWTRFACTKIENLGEFWTRPTYVYTKIANTANPIVIDHFARTEQRGTLISFEEQGLVVILRSLAALTECFTASTAREL